MISKHVTHTERQLPLNKERELLVSCTPKTKKSELMSYYVFTYDPGI